MDWSDIFKLITDLLKAKDAAGAGTDPVTVVMLVGVPMLGAVTVALIRVRSAWWPATLLTAFALLGAFLVRTLPDGSIGGPHSVPGQTASGASVPTATGFSPLDDTFLTGTVVLSLDAIPTPAACADACRTHAACRAFTFDQPTRSCQLKRDVGQEEAMPGSTSGILRDRMR
jgi:PAN domain